MGDMDFGNFSRIQKYDMREFADILVTRVIRVTPTSKSQPHYLDLVSISGRIISSWRAEPPVNALGRIAGHKITKLVQFMP